MIGYNIDGRYVEKVTKSCANGPYFLSYGSVALVKNVSDDLWAALLKVFDPNEATSIIASAFLRVIYPGVTDSLYYPGAALSKNTMTSLEKRIGHDPENRKQYLWITALSR